MRSRLDLAGWLPKGEVAAEIGVEKGGYSADLIAMAQPSRFYMVDIFSGAYLATPDLNAEYERLTKLYERDNRISVVKSDSIQWLRSQPDNSLGWVYIDSSHELNATSLELRESRRVVKNGGYICGHDYHVHIQGVVQAVDRYCSEFNAALELWSDDPWASYCIKNVK